MRIADKQKFIDSLPEDQKESARELFRLTKRKEIFNGDLSTFKLQDVAYVCDKLVKKDLLRLAPIMLHYIKDNDETGGTYEISDSYLGVIYQSTEQECALMYADAQELFYVFETVYQAMDRNAYGSTPGTRCPIGIMDRATAYLLYSGFATKDILTLKKGDLDLENGIGRSAVFDKEIKIDKLFLPVIKEAETCLGVGHTEGKSFYLEESGNLIRRVPHGTKKYQIEDMSLQQIDARVYRSIRANFPAYEPEVPFRKGKGYTLSAIMRSGAFSRMLDAENRLGVEFTRDDIFGKGQNAVVLDDIWPDRKVHHQRPDSMQLYRRWKQEYHS